MSCDHELVNEWALCSGKAASYITNTICWVCKSRTEEVSNVTPQTDRKKQEILAGTGRLNFHLVTEKKSTGLGFSGSITKGCTG